MRVFSKLMMVTMMVLGSSAFADGFVCYTHAKDIKIKMLNHTDPKKGTRKGAIMVVSDETVGNGEKTMISFMSEDQTLKTEETTWTGTVIGNNHVGHEVIGTDLNHIRTFMVDAYHNYAYPVPDGSFFYGQLSVVKIDKSVQREDLDCYRYMKNDPQSDVTSM